MSHRPRSDTVAPMRTTDDVVLRLSLAVLGALVVGQCLAGCSETERALPLLPVPMLPTLDVFTLSPPEPEPVVEQPRRDERAGWCEPLDPPPCPADRRCPDGTECVTPWWASGDVEVCSMPTPDKDGRRVQVERLGVFVDHVCQPADGCRPGQLLAYLRLLAVRESSLRPWKRHRLDPDLAANELAWSRHRAKFAENPAAVDPDRWMTGLGLYAQIPALWLPRWDVDAPPEVLCGVVESTEVHLRAARDQVRKIGGGVDCDGDGEPDYWGSACEESEPCRPSWYDASRTNSGSLCPGDEDHRRRFAERAADVGLDPWALVGSADLGEPIPRAEQDAVAELLRERMDATR